MGIGTLEKKLLAIIGAGEGALPIIFKAKEMGVKTLAFARSDSFAKNDVDIFIEENNFDIEFMISKCKEYHVDGIMPSSELTTEIAAKVAHGTGLPGNDVAQGFAGKNKFVMRQRVSKAQHIKQPKYSLYTTSTSYEFPAVVKPVDACGKRGVNIANNIDELEGAIIMARENSSDHSVLIEEYLSGGQEYSIECLSWGWGKHQVVQYTEKESAGPPHFVEIAHHQPANLSDEMKRNIDVAVNEVLDLLGLSYGMAHMEIKIIDGEIFFIEVGARGGGDHISDILTPFSTGFDYYRSAIECALGCYKYKPAGHKAFTGIYFHCRQNEHLQPLFNRAKTASWCIKNTVQDGAFTEALGNVDASNSGYIIYCADHRIGILDS